MPDLCKNLRSRQVDALCALLNQEGPNDWRYLAEHLLGYRYQDVSSIRRKDNPCGEILDRWMAQEGDKATTKRLLEVLNVDMMRRDAVDALTNPGWCLRSFHVHVIGRCCVSISYYPCLYAGLESVKSVIQSTCALTCCLNFVCIFFFTFWDGCKLVYETTASHSPSYTVRLAKGLRKQR